MTASNRRRWTAEEKLRILREAHQIGQTVSEVCRRPQISPGQFYAWEKLAGEGALEYLRNGRRRRKKADGMGQLQAEMERYRVVVAELSAENLQLKKGLRPQDGVAMRPRRKP